MAAVIGKYRIALLHQFANDRARKFLAETGVDGAEEFALMEERKKAQLDLVGENGLSAKPVFEICEIQIFTQSK